MIVIALLGCMVLVWCLAPIAAVAFGRAFRAGQAADQERAVTWRLPAA